MPGTARAALAVVPFRRLWIGSFASNIGTWMQNVALPAYAEDRWESATFVALLIFAQLGPLLLLSVPAGVLADKVDRRRWLVAMQGVQLACSLALAVLALGEPSKGALFAVALGVGIGNALNAPAWVATLPTLVGRENVAGAVSLNSALINGTRVAGPALAGLALPVIGLAGIFAVNAATYLFVIAALLMVTIPRPPTVGTQGLRQLTFGFAEARRVPVAGTCLVTIAVFSFFCLTWVGQFAVVANRNFDMDVQSAAYGLLYAAFGLGGAAGGLSCSTWFAGTDPAVLARRFLWGYVAALAVFAVVRSPLLAFPSVLVLGFVYFGFTTSLLTLLQLSVDDTARGRVMSLWMMGFGGTVPIGNLVFGPLIDLTSATAVLAVGVVVAFGLAWWLDLAGARDRSPLPAGAGSPVGASANLSPDAAGLRRTVRRPDGHGDTPGAGPARLDAGPRRSRRHARGTAGRGPRPARLRRRQS